MQDKLANFRPETKTRRSIDTAMRFPLAVIQPQKSKEKCCKKYKEGKQCKRCPLL